MVSPFSSSPWLDGHILGEGCLEEVTSKMIIFNERWLHKSQFSQVTDPVELNTLSYWGATTSLDLPFCKARVRDTIQVLPFRLALYSNLNEHYLLYDQSAIPNIWSHYVESFPSRGTADLVLVVTVKYNVKSVQITMRMDYGSSTYSPEMKNENNVKVKM